MRITKATFKSFLNRNAGKLWIKCASSFDGMVDMVTQDQQAEFNFIEETGFTVKHTLGIKRLWLVGQSRDYFTAYEDAEFKGIEVSNCCGNQIVAVRK